MFRLATGRFPSEAETAILVSRYEAEFQRLDGDPVTTRLMLKTWLAPRGASDGEPLGGSAELVAWMHVANVVLNLDEVITRE
jgi:hypothetical protein